MAHTHASAPVGPAPWPARVTNPVLPGCHPDPSVCRVGADFYLACSSFHQWPGLPLFHSRDLVHWRPVGHALTRQSQLDLDGCPSGLGVFAPTLRHHGGRFWLVSTQVHRRRNFLVWAEQIGGPWSDPVWLDWPGIDPSLCFLEDGRVILSGNGGFLGDEPSGIYQAELDLATGRLCSPRRLVWAGSGGHAPEGPHLYQRSGWYYLLVAEGGTEYGHMVTVARSRDPMGPFEACPYNPVLSHRSTGHPLQATGHADLVQAVDGRWFALLLGIRPAPLPFAPRRHHLGRETLLAPVVWDEAGWPCIGQPAGTVPLHLASADLLPLQPWPLSPLRSPAEGAVQPSDASHADPSAVAEQALHGPAWLHLRQPPPGACRLDRPSGVLHLHGQPGSLTETVPQAFMGRRQTDFDCTATVRLRFMPTAQGEEAGLTAYMSEQFHYSLALACVNGQRQLLWRRRLGSLWRVEHQQAWPHAAAWLQLRADATWYSAWAGPSLAELAPVGRGECGLLAAEVAGGFTGVLLGLYATGHGRACGQPALFDHWSCLPASALPPSLTPPL